MNKKSFFGLVILFLLLSNLILAGVIFFRKGHRAPPPEGPKKMIINALSFNPEQIRQYEELIRKHQHDIREQEDQIKELKVKLYEQLNHPDSSVVKDSLMQALANLQLHIEQIHYAHFGDIKNLCNEKQLQHFAQLTRELPRMFHRGPKPGHP